MSSANEVINAVASPDASPDPVSPASPDAPVSASAAPVVADVENVEAAAGDVSS